MKHNIDTYKSGVSIKWKVFLYLMLFATVIAAVLWLCEIVFLDDIYKNIKINDVMKSSSQISKALDSPDMVERVDEIATDNDSCAMVFKNENGTLVHIGPIYCYRNFYDCAIHRMMNEENFLEIYNITRNNGGENLERFAFIIEENTPIGIEGKFFGKTAKPDRSIKAVPESIIYSVITENEDGDELFIVINSQISPLESTVSTLNRILCVVTILLYALALAFALIISYRVTKPIRRLTYSALDMAKGNYQTNFSADGYLEISQLADTLNYAEKELSRVDELRRELIANISHDLRTPMTMIRGYSEVMRDIPGENTPENIQVIIDETNRLTNLVNDVLDISRLESGNASFEPAPFDLTRSTENILQRFAKLCEKDGYSIDFFCERNVYVNADETRIGQVIYNLVGNAVTHTGDSKQVIVRQLTEHGKVRIEVEDFGMGIEADKLPDIWERYYKLDRVHKRAVIGTGLGLSIVRNIMERSGGSYGVSSAVGQGSVFWIELDEFKINTESFDE